MNVCEQSGAMLKKCTHAKINLSWTDKGWKKCKCDSGVYLSGQDAQEDEDEHALEGVGDGEEIGSEGGFVEDVQHAEGPGRSQHEEQGQSTAGTRPGGYYSDFSAVCVDADKKPPLMMSRRHNNLT